MFLFLNFFLSFVPLSEIWKLASMQHESLVKDNILREYCTPDLKSACLVCYLKIIDTFWKNNVCILQQIA